MIQVYHVDRRHARYSIHTCSRFFAIIPLSAYVYQSFFLFAMLVVKFVDWTETDFSRMFSRLHMDSSKVLLSDSAIICWMTPHPN